MFMLAVVLPVLCFAALLKRDDFRESFLASAAATGCFVALATEMLSLFHALAYTQVVLCWAGYLLVVLAWRLRSRATDGKSAPSAGATAFQKVLLGLLAGIVCLTGITAVVAAPNNFDSLTYHLPRIMHWIQNRSVAHYPTHIDRQLLLAPFSEYLMMHLQLLSGGDRFANCVQWFALAGSAVGVSLIARELRGSLNCQIVAATLCVSVPMGLLQSTSTQNDYAVTFWLVCLAYYVVRSQEHPGAINTLLVGVSLALAIFTKGTAYLVAFPFLLVYFGRACARSWSRAALNLVAVIALLLLVNGGHYARNVEVYGNPISPGTGNGVVSTKFGVAATISCLTKNIATQLSSGLPGANRALGAAVNAVHHAIGIATNDPGLNLDDIFLIVPARIQEDTAANPAHMILLLLASATLAVSWKRRSPELLLFAGATLLSFVVLSVGLKWNPYISRYFLPVLVISAPLVSLTWDRVKLDPAVNTVAVCLLAYSFFILAHNEMRPLTGPRSVFVTDRIDQYFMARPQAKPYFLASVNMIKGQPLTNVGLLDRDGNMWEYVLWVLLQADGPNYRIEHVEVENASGAIRLQDFSRYFPVRI